MKYGVIVAVFGFAALVALAKVALGQHWTTDVIAGDFAGLGGGFICASYIVASQKK